MFVGLFYLFFFLHILCYCFLTMVTKSHAAVAVAVAMAFVAATVKCYFFACMPACLPACMSVDWLKFFAILGSETIFYNKMVVYAASVVRIKKKQMQQHSF